MKVKRLFVINTNFEYSLKSQVLFRFPQQIERNKNAR